MARPRTKKKRPAPVNKSRRAGYIIAIIINAALLLVINNLWRWSVPYLTPGFNRALPAINASLVATFVGNLAFLFYDLARFRHLVQMVLNVMAFVAAYTLYSVFPFAVTDAWRGWLSFGLIAVMAGLGIAFVVELVQFLRGKD